MYIFVSLLSIVSNDDNTPNHYIYPYNLVAPLLLYGKGKNIVNPFPLLYFHKKKSPS